MLFVQNQIGVKLNNRMKKILLILSISLTICGCTSLNSTHGQANGGILEVEPTIGRLAIGYGSLSFVHTDIVAGQGMKFKSEQYQLTSSSTGGGSNLLYTETMEIMPLTSGTVTVTKEQKPLFQVFGIRIDNPFSNPVATLEFIPSNSIISTNKIN